MNILDKIGKRQWIHIIHILVVALPIYGLSYKRQKGDEVPEWTNHFFILLAITAFMYHGYYLVTHLTA